MMCHSDSPARRPWGRFCVANLLPPEGILTAEMEGGSYEHPDTASWFMCGALLVWGLDVK